MECDKLLSIDFSKAFASGGCPICRLLRKVEVEHIFSMLYENVNDPVTRIKLRKSLGLCPFHAWLLVEVVFSSPEIHPMSPSIIYEDIIGEAINAVENGSTLTIQSRCPVCSIVDEFEEIYIEGFAACAESPGFLVEYESSNSVLCLKHYEKVIKRVSKETMKKLRRIQVKKLRRLRELMRSFIDKQDYRSSEKATEEEALAWVAAIEALKGYKTSVAMSRCGGGKPRSSRFLRRGSR